MHDPKSIARLVVRVGFGLALAFVGFAHYQDPQFAAQVGQGLGILTPLAVVWGYVFPGLMIFGGVLLAFGIYLHIAAYAASIALVSIPAGLALKSAISGLPLEDTMPGIANALIWIIVLLMSLNGCCCASPVAVPQTQPSVKPVQKPAPKPAPIVVKSAPAAPAATMKKPSSPKKAPVKKSVPSKTTAPKVEL